MALAILSAHVAFRASVAYAIAYAPNGGGIGRGARVGPPPPGAREISVDVGPPRATLRGWVLSPERPRGTIVLLHGLRLDRRSMLPFALKFTAAGYRSVLVDLRGHGESTGTHLTYGQVEAHDVSQLLDGLGETGPIGVFGYSYGGAVAVHLAAEDDRIAAVVALSSFATVRRAVGDYERRYFSGLERWVPDSWLDDAVDDAAWIGAFDPDASPARAVARIRAPLLLVHGGADTQVPPEHAAILDDAAARGTQLLVLPGETHESVLRDPRGQVAESALGLFARTL